jgi:IclR family pca regulon transcriptional regulator
MEPDFSLSALSDAVRLPPSTVYRYIATLQQLGHIRQNKDTKRYSLTPKILDLGFTMLRSLELRKRLLPYMIETTNQLGVTTQCAILNGTEIVYLERVPAKNVVNLDISVGTRLPAYCTSMGKVQLAYLGEEERREKVEEMDLVPLTPFTITDKEILLKELEQIRMKGIATNNQELNEGLFTMAAPVFKEGLVEGALGFSMPSYLFGSMGENNLKMSELFTRLLDITRKVSIGDVPNIGS